MAETRKSSRLSTKAKKPSAKAPNSSSVYFESDDEQPEPARNSASKKPPLKSRYFDPDFRDDAESAEQDTRPKKKKTQPRNSRKKPQSETDDSEEEPSNKRKSVTEILQSKSALKLSSDESDSSCDEVPVRATDTVHESDDEPVDTEPAQKTEYFDFTSLLSKVSQSNEKKEATAETPTLKREPSVQQMEVCELLAMGEDVNISAKEIKKSVTKTVEKYEIPKQVEVFLDGPVAPKSKRKGNDLEAALRRRLNCIQREKQTDIHKVHILCFIAHGLRLNAQLNSADVLGMALSLLPNDKCYPPKRMSMEYLENLINWFYDKIQLKKVETGEPRTGSLVARLETQLENLEANSKIDLCFMFVTIVRALGIKCRLIINLNTAPLKPPSDQLLAVNLKPAEATTSKTSKPPEKKTSHSSEKSNEKKSSSSRSKGAKKESTYFKEASKPSSRRSGSSQSAYFPKDKSPRKKTKDDRKKKDPRKEQEEYFVEEMSTSDDTDEEEVFVPVKKKKIDRRVLSSDEESVPEPKSKSKSKPNKNNYWSEVFLEAEEKWVCVDIVKKSYHCAQQLYVSFFLPP